VPVAPSTTITWYVPGVEGAVNVQVNGLGSHEGGGQLFPPEQASIFVSRKMDPEPAPTSDMFATHVAPVWLHEGQSRTG
jgi:hypothetical protein